MLKKFFTVFLGSVAAIWFSILLFIGIIFISVVMWLSHLGVENKIDSNSILYLDLSGDIPDRYTRPTVEDIVMGGETNPMTFDEILSAVKLAKTDSNITGIYINARGSSMGLALRQELRTALADFKKSGKWILAYGDNYNQGDYYTSAIADWVYINPSGSLSANGLAATVPFFKNALDKLGVEVQVIKVGTFKSAVEPFILTQMSDSARMMYDVMLDAMWKGYVDDVVADLGNSAVTDSVFCRMAATPMIGFTTQELIDAGLFDNSMYAYQLDDLLKKKSGGVDELRLVSPREYLSSFPETDLKTLDNDRRHVAVLYALGDIVDTGNGGIVGDQMVPLINRLADDDNVRGLVLRVNSGGGSAFASEQIWAALENLKAKGKPFVVSMGDVAASGGYYISCGADRIYADPATITGSIGIFGVIPYAKELLNDKLGINFDVVETNPNVVLGRLDAPLTDAQHAALEKSIHNGYDLFIKRVTEGRHLDEAHVRRIAEGRVWPGSMALTLGLVDEMDGLQAAVEYVLGKTDLGEGDVVEYPVRKLSPLDMLLTFDDSGELREMLASDAIGALGMTARELRESTGVVRRMRGMNVIQAKMEDITVR